MNQSAALFLDKASVYPDDLDFSSLESVAKWQWFDNMDLDVNIGSISHVIETADIIVSNKAMLDKDVIDRCAQLKLICVAATGVNNVDVDAARNRGVQVCNVRAYATSSVTQHVFSLILALSRKLSSYRLSVKNGKWSGSDFFCYFDEPFADLEGKTLGVIGYGELGRSVAGIAEKFGMNVLVARRQNSGSEEGDKRDGRVDLVALLSQSDVVSLHCPLTESNHNMIGSKELSLMKKDAILINTARGGLVDEDALLHALQNKIIGGAGLDVLNEEPPPVDNKLINYNADNLIITPHVAWASRESRQRLIDEVAKNIRAFQQGQPRNIV